jgi:uncharacterized membrane protein
MGLAIMICGLVLFIGGHLFVTLREHRAATIARCGEGPYKIVFSILAALGILLIAYGFSVYRNTGWVDLWVPPRWTRHVTEALMLPAVILVVAAYIPSHIRSALKHPMLAGVKLWAAAHLIANGDLGSVILFGSLLAWAVYDRIAVKRRAGTATPPLPPAGWRNDAIAVAAGLLAYFALGFWFHPLVIGVTVFGA